MELVAPFFKWTPATESGANIVLKLNLDPFGPLKCLKNVTLVAPFGRLAPFPELTSATEGGDFFFKTPPSSFLERISATEGAANMF